MSRTSRIGKSPCGGRDNVPFVRGGAGLLKPQRDGRFTFARLKFTTGWGGGQAWGHEYPEADENLVRILDAITNLGPRLDATAVVAIDDPDLFKYPITCTTEMCGHRVQADRGIERRLQAGRELRRLRLDALAGRFVTP